MLTHAPLMLAGLIAATGLWLLILALVPTQARLADAVERLSPRTLRLAPARTTAAAPTTRLQRLATNLHARAPQLPGISPTSADLAMLTTTPADLVIRKLLYSLAGLTLPLVYTAATSTFLNLGLALPAAAGIFGAFAGWFLPDSQLRTRAKARRAEFVRACVAYLQLVAIQRMASANVYSAMTGAAQVSDSWPFRRIRAELIRAEWAHIPPWEALTALGEQIEVTELADIGDIMRTAGETGAGVADSLLARANALRDQLLAEATTEANKATTAMTLPLGGLFIVMVLAISFPLVVELLG